MDKVNEFEYDVDSRASADVNVNYVSFEVESNIH